jgi:hypothetical protein
LGTVPFSKRLAEYRKADVALSIGTDTVEDDLSARTRVVDYLGAGLPLLSPGRDEYSSEIISGGAGFRYDSSDSLAAWMRRLVLEPELISSAQSRISSLVQGPFNGSSAVQPIRRFIDDPYLTPRAHSYRDLLRSGGLWLRDFSRSLRQGRP